MKSYKMQSHYFHALIKIFCFLPEPRHDSCSSSEYRNLIWSQTNVKCFIWYRQSSAYTVLWQHGFLNNTVYFGTLICPLSTKSLLRLHGFLLTRLFFQSLKKLRKQRTSCMLSWKPHGHNDIALLKLNYCS